MYQWLMYNSGRIKLATAAKVFAVPRNTLRRKATDYSDDDNRGLLACAVETERKSSCANHAYNLTKRLLVCQQILRHYSWNIIQLSLC
jgi:hypothetical protein